MNSLTPRFILLALSFVSGACISRIDVKKINNNDINAVSKAKGVRYSLPQPFVIGTPQQNGKVSYRVEYLPDPDNEYAVSSWSFMAKHKLKLGRSSSGMLKSVNYTQDDTAVASAMVDTAGNLAEAQIKAMAAAAAKKPSGADAPDGRDGQDKAVTTSQAPGAVIYRVVEDPHYGVRLEPVSFKATLNGGSLRPDQQRWFETTGTQDGAPAPVAAKPALKSPDSIQLKKSDFSAATDPFVPITFDTKVNKEGVALTQVSDNNKDRTSWCNVELENSDKATLTLKRAEIEPGSYKLSLTVSNAKNKALMSKLSIFIVVTN